MSRLNSPNFEFTCCTEFTEFVTATGIRQRHVSYNRESRRRGEKNKNIAGRKGVAHRYLQYPEVLRFSPGFQRHPEDGPAQSVWVMVEQVKGVAAAAIRPGRYALIAKWEGASDVVQSQEPLCMHCATKVWFSVSVRRSEGGQTIRRSL